jgi:DivIVA domain-containing protein
MELVPKTLREVEFREKLRGYNQDDVDDFLEQVAVGLEALQEQLRQATERATRTGDQREPFADDDDPVRRTLVLAQRTADMAIKEAREQAAEIVAAADARAQATVSQADEAANLRRESAESEVRAEVERLTLARETLAADITALEEHLEQARSTARSSLGDALRWLEDHVHKPPSRPELQTDPQVVSRLTGGGLSAEPDEAGSDEMEGEQNGNMGIRDQMPSYETAVVTPADPEQAAGSGSAGWPWSSRPDDDRPGGSESDEGSAGEVERPEAESSDDRAPDAERSDAPGEEPTEALPTVSPGQQPRALFDAEELDEHQPPGSAPTNRF